jgi:hypothetical protein
MSTQLTGQQLHDISKILKELLTGASPSAEQLEEYGFKLVSIANYEKPKKSVF